MSQPTEGHLKHHLHESDTALEKDLLDNLRHLKGVGREVQRRLDVRETVVTEERVDTEVTCVVGHLVNWMGSVNPSRPFERHMNSPPE